MMRSGKDLAQLGLLGRAYTTSALNLAVPTVSTGTSGGGLFNFLDTKRVSTPMDTPLDGVDPVTPAPVSATPPATETTQLPNGVRLAAQNVMTPMATVGIVVNTGSVHEVPQTAGATHLIESMVFKGSASRTHFATVRQAENYGITLGAQAGRETSCFFATCPRDNVAAAMEILCDSVLNPSFEQHVLEQQKGRILSHVGNMVQDPGFVASEGVVTAAYTGALARPLFFNDATPINSELLKDFHREFYTPGNMVVAAAGVDLQTVQSLASDYLSPLASAPATPAPPSHYVGGDRCDHFSGGATALVAFETVGWRSLEESVLATVTQYLMGGGSDFSSGGPGKGMHSRLYQNVLARNPWVTSCTTYANLFETTGLFGVLMSTPLAEQGPELVDILCSQLELLTSNVNGEEVERAKRQCLSQVLAALEMPNVVSEDIGRQMISFGRRVSIDEFKKIIQAVSPDDVKNYARKLLATKPSAVLLGDQAIMPKSEFVRARFS